MTGKNRTLRFVCRLILSLLCLVVCDLHDGIAQMPDTARAQGILDTIPRSLLERLNAGEPREVIVEFASADIEAEAAAFRAQRGIRYDDHDVIEFKSQRFRQIKDQVFGRVSAVETGLLLDFSHLPMALLRLRSGSALLRLLEFSEVTAVYENRIIYLHLVQSLPLINQPQAAAAGYRGMGATVAVIDTGVNYMLPEFGSCTSPGVPAACKVTAAVEIAPDDNSLDDNGHGTNVSAISVGVAPDSRIAALDVFNPGGGSTDALVISGINWAIANKADYNIVAINMSLGDGVNHTSPCSNWHTNPYVTPVSQVRAAGILPVASAGNEASTNGMASPACTPGIISVGAVYDANLGGLSYGFCADSATAADKVTCFSNSAFFLTMLAPGAAITAGGYTKYGTSQASPHVAGAVAVLRSAYPSETIDAITGRLTSSGQPVADPRNGIQKPRLDLLNALGTAPVAVVPALSGYGASGLVLVLALLGMAGFRTSPGRRTRKRRVRRDTAEQTDK